MDTFIRFLYEFMSVFFNGLFTIGKGFVSGIMQMFDISEYLYIIQFYKSDFKMSEWVLVVVAIIVLVILLALILLIFWFIIRKYIRFRKTLVEQESMLNEIAELNKKVTDLVKEKEDILAMKVSQLGLKPNESPTDEAEILKEESKDEVEALEDEDESKYRFSKLHAIDIEYRDYKIQNYNNTFTLEELVEHFRNFAASKLKLYYTTKMIRLFI